MISTEMNKMLVAKFPNLREKYLDEVSWQGGDDTGSHIVYGDVFTPYLADSIEKDSKQEFQIAFDFLEGLLEMENGCVNEVVSFSVLESLMHLFKEREYLISCLGIKCQQALREVLNG